MRGYKMSDKNNKRGTILAVVIIAFLVASKILLSPFGGLDELWNYNLCRGVSMGYVPYRDFGMVMMPLYTMLFAIPLFFVRKLIVYRIVSVIFLIILVARFYVTAKRESDADWGLALSCLFVAFMDISTYNSLLFLFAMICYRFLDREMTSKRALILGALCALSILSRQTSGVFLTILCVVIFLRDKKLRGKIFYALAGGAAPLVIFLIYLFMTSSWTQFWDHCLFALVSSGDKNSAFYGNSIPALILIVSGVIADVFLWKKKHAVRDLYHLTIGIVIASMGIPTVDLVHLFYAGMWFVIPLVKLIKSSGSPVKPQIVNLITGLCAVTVMFLNIYNLAGCSLDNRFSELVLIPSDKSIIDTYADINSVNSDMEESGHKVIFFSCSACISSILDESFNPPYDLFLTGNMGTTDPVSYVVAASSDANNVILIPDDYDTENWENPKGIFDAVRSNCVPVASYGRFVWYIPEQA